MSYFVDKSGANQRHMTADNTKPILNVGFCPPATGTPILAVIVNKGDHMNTNKVNTAESALADTCNGELILLSLDGLLPVDQALVVNTDCLVISLILTNSTSSSPILRQKHLTEAQMRSLLPLLRFPGYCQHEILLASLFCSYQGLLASLFSSDRTAREEWLSTVQKTALFLEHAREQGTRRKELKQLYNVISELRPKLRPFSLGIIPVAGSAYALISLPAINVRIKWVMADFGESGNYVWT